MNPAERVDMETAFVLHVRAYRETSHILEVFSQRHGRAGLVARGARRPRSRWTGLLEPFRPLHLSWAGRGSLHTLRAAEASGPPPAITGMGLMAGYYLNELLLAFIRRGDPHPELFAHYTAALAGLADRRALEATLRHFEITLLAEIGYGLILDRDTVTDEPLENEARYRYVIDQGPVRLTGEGSHDLVFTGAQLRAMGAGDLAKEEQLRCAKRLLRAVLQHHLGGRRLKTREVMSAMHR